MNEGFIKLFRSMTDWEWYQDSNTKVVFLHLLLNANWEDYRFKGYEIPKGSVVVGRKKLSRDLNISEKSVRTALKHLKMTNEVTIKTTNKFSIVTIVNWDKYQGREIEGGQQSDQQSGQQLASNWPTTGHNIRNKEIKNIRREEEGENSINPEEVQNLFNKICIFFKPCMTIGKASLPKIRKLGQQYSLEEIREVFEKANKSKFLQGSNDRGWSATFDWIITPENFEKIMAGNYDNSESQKSSYHDYKHGNYNFEALEYESKHKWEFEDAGNNS